MSHLMADVWLVCVAQACATRKFHHGRTETIRSATTDSKAFVEALNSNAPKVTIGGLDLGVRGGWRRGEGKGCGGVREERPQ
eukprot:429330-Prorocentrum_minimum.AAC.1